MLYKILKKTPIDSSFSDPVLETNDSMVALRALELHTRYHDFLKTPILFCLIVELQDEDALQKQ